MLLPPFNLPLCVHFLGIPKASRWLHGGQKELRRNRTDFTPCLMEHDKLHFLLAGSLPCTFVVAVDFSSELCPQDLK